MIYLAGAAAIGMLIFLVERHEVRCRESRRLSRKATHELLRAAMLLHPADKTGRIPKGW